MISAF